jgi:hypothetical protein
MPENLLRLRLGRPGPGTGTAPLPSLAFVTRFTPIVFSPLILSDSNVCPSRPLGVAPSRQMSLWGAQVAKRAPPHPGQQDVFASGSRA